MKAPAWGRLSNAQKRDVLEKQSLLDRTQTALRVTLTNSILQDADLKNGAFVPPMLFCCSNPDSAQHVHDVEAFGPVSTIMAYRIWTMQQHF